MSVYVQYQKYDSEGFPVVPLPFASHRFQIWTRRPEVKKADGRAFLIFGIGKPRQYYLWEALEISPSRIERQNEKWCAYSDSGQHPLPPQRLRGAAFDDFRIECRNFRSFRRIDDLAYADVLAALADQHVASQDNTVYFEQLRQTENLCTEFITLSGRRDADPYIMRGYVRLVLGSETRSVEYIRAALSDFGDACEERVGNYPHDGDDSLAELVADAADALVEFQGERAARAFLRSIGLG